MLAELAARKESEICMITEEVKVCLEPEKPVPDAPKQPTEAKAPKDLDARKKPKYQHESRKARAAREVREELQRYR